MRRFVATPSDIITRVNVTPIIDVALVLVIILLVTAPMLAVSDLPVRLPEARTREAEDQRNVSITLSGDGRLALDDVMVPRGTLRAHLAAKLSEQANQNVLVVLRADASAPYNVVSSILSDARAAGAKRLAIATRQTMAAQP